MLASSTHQNQNFSFISQKKIFSFNSRLFFFWRRKTNLLFIQLVGKSTNTKEKSSDGTPFIQTDKEDENLILLAKASTRALPGLNV